MLLKQLRERLLKDIGEILLAPGGKKSLKDMDTDGPDLSGIAVGEPKNKSFGDISTNAAMVLAPVLKEDPMKIAGILDRSIIRKWDEAENISIARPGFINFYLSRGFIGRQLTMIADKNKEFGKNDSGKNIRVQIEFVR